MKTKVGEVGAGNLMTDTLRASLERRDQHIGRLNERLGAASEVVRIARTVLHLHKNKTITLDPDTERELRDAVGNVDEIEKRNKNILERLQGKRADRVPK